MKELIAIKNLNSAAHIIILPAYKGNTAVVSKTDDYIQKIQKLLEPETYQNLNKDQGIIKT